MNFVLFAISFIILLALVTQAQKFGRYDIWRDPIKGAFIPASMSCVSTSDFVVLLELGWSVLRSFFLVAHI